MKVFSAIAIAVLCLAVASAERTLLQATCGNGGKAANGNCNCAGGTVPAVDASNNFLCLNGQSQVVDNNNNPIFNCPSGGGGGGNGGGGGGGGGGGSSGGGVVANNGNNVNTNTNTNINNGNINNGNINSNNNNGNIFINTGSCNGPNACSVQRVTTGTLFARVSAGRHLLQACSPVSNVGSLPANTPLYSDASCTQQVGTATGNGQPIINPTNKGAFTPVGSPIPQDQIGKVSSPPAMAPGAAAQAPGAMAPKSGAASPPTGAVAPKSGAASPPTGASTSPMMSGSPMAMSGSPMSPKSGSPMTMSPTTMSPTTMSPMQTPGASAKPATSSPSGASPPPTATPMSTPAAANKPATSSPTANAANNASPSPAGRR